MDSEKAGYVVLFILLLAFEFFCVYMLIKSFVQESPAERKKDLIQILKAFGMVVLCIVCPLIIFGFIDKWRGGKK